MTVDPVEVADGDSWKVHLCLVTHVCTCHNRVFPKVDHNLLIRLCFSLLFYNLIWNLPAQYFVQLEQQGWWRWPTYWKATQMETLQCWATHHINALPRLLALDALLMPEIEVSVPKLKIIFFISKITKCCSWVTKQNILFVYQWCFSEM